MSRAIAIPGFKLKDGACQHTHRSPKPKGWKTREGSYCGAWAATRKRACRRWPQPGMTRCRLHGGMSSGPKTSEGRKVISEMRKREWADHRARLGLPENWRYGSTWLSRRQRETAADWVAAHGPEGEETPNG